MKRLINTICRALDEGKDLVLATILSHSGSTPRTAGTKMVVISRDNIVGTIGGGILEAEVIETALGILVSGGAQIRSFNLASDAMTDSMDMICGGRVEVLVESIKSNPDNLTLFKSISETLDKGKTCRLVTMLPHRKVLNGSTARCLIADNGQIIGRCDWVAPHLKQLFEASRRQTAPLVVEIDDLRFMVEAIKEPGTVYIFGAGHVSLELANLAHMVEFRTVVLDDRPEYANAERFVTADETRVLSNFNHAFDGLLIDMNSYLVIVTRGHRHDEIVLSQALKTNAGYIGMIGSRQKRDNIYRSLCNEGFTDEDLKRVHSPIGLTIGAQSPAEIAVSIVAELIKHRSGSH